MKTPFTPTYLSIRLSLILFLLSALDASAQEKQQPLPVRVVRATTGTVATWTNAQKQTISVVSKEEKVRRFGGATQTETKYSIVLPNKKKLALKDGESFYGKGPKETFWTMQAVSTDTSAKTILRTYTVKNNALTVLKEAEIPGYENSLNPIDGTANWLYDDTSEGLGNEVAILDENLKTITSYKPFEEGFQDTRSSVNNQRVGVFIQPLSADKPLTIAYFDGRNGQLLFEKNLPQQGRHVSAIYANDRYVVVSVRGDSTAAETVCYDAKGQLLWSKPTHLLDDYAVLQNGEGSLLAQHDYEDLTAYDLQTGNTAWKQHIMDFHKTAKPDFMGVPVKIELNGDNSLYLLVKDFPTDKVTKEALGKSTHSTTLYRIDWRGQLITTQSLGELSAKITIQQSENNEKTVFAEKVDATLTTTTVLVPLRTWPVVSAVKDAKGRDRGRIVGSLGEFRPVKLLPRCHAGIDIRLELY